MTIKEKKIIVKTLLLGFFTMKLKEEEEGAVWMMIRELVPDPYFMDYIYQTDEFIDENDELDVDGVIEKGFSYKPIAL
ncbi:MAG: hypothetical protein KKE73_11565 [Proteobacteria bacterium]|nr:hypothetical protein [Pseudomonadota bacterium]